MKHWLSYTNLSDGYERKARFAPALLTVLFLMPLSAASAGPLGGWVNVLLTGVGAGAVVAIGLSHVASAAGNQIQRQLWPQWPFDSPTNRWLHPTDNTRSKQQRQRWYMQLRKLTGLDIAAHVDHADPTDELDRVINDAVSKCRYLLRNSEHADRLRVHNADYGFARNFAGLRPIWLTFAVISMAGCWLAVWFGISAVVTAVTATAVLIAAIALAAILPAYIRTRAESYAESFFGAVSLLAEEPTPDASHTDNVAAPSQRA